MKFLGFAALEAKAALAPFSFERRALRADDVLIDILYCGVCHSDLHMAQNDWGFARYPLVPGHEIVGRVQQVGAQVSKFKVGDLVGVGCMVDSCRHCSACAQGEEQYCEQGNTATYAGIDRHDGQLTFGGYSTGIICSQDFVLRVSEQLDTQAVAPLLCAGITTWSPLRHWNVGPSSKVGVIGLGGLGHMAIKLAHALGAEVTLFTRSQHKIEDAQRLGADHVVLSQDEKQMQAVKNQFDLIIDTVPNQHDIQAYIPTLSLNGSLVFVGYLGPLEEMLNTVPLILGRRSVAGSLIGGIQDTQDMLDFCAEHNITADVEVIAMQEINHAFARMQNSDVKYRFVIDMNSLKSVNEASA
jgi:alcohol dehydrogenase (NADP+)